MAYVIAQPCIGVKDNSCVEVCPVDCIHATDDSEQYYINPDECIDCRLRRSLSGRGDLLRRRSSGAVGVLHARQRRVLQEPVGHSIWKARRRPSGGGAPVLSDRPLIRGPGRRVASRRRALTQFSSQPFGRSVTVD